MVDIEEYINTEDALFHYTKTSIAIEHILHTKKFKLSVLSNSNDPREYKFTLFNMSGWSLSHDKMSDLLSRATPVVDRIRRGECRVMCFCTNNKPTLILSDDDSVKDENVNSEGWNKSRMWSQYGQNHYGICLVFSKEELEKVLAQKESQTKGYKADYVQYSQQPRIDWEALNLNGNKAETEGVEEYSYNHVKENFKQLFFQKHIDYRDEAEFRVVVFDPDKKLEYLDISSSIKGVIVGDRTPEVYFSLINKMCEDLNIESRRVYWDRGEPNLLLCRTT